MPKSSIDAKGRMNFPSKLREELGETFVITKTLRTKAKTLTVYSVKEWEELVTKIKAMPMIKAQDIQDFLFSERQKVEPDKQGRFVMYPELRKYAGIEGDSEVMVTGLEGKAEIWSMENWIIKMKEENIEELVSTAMELGL